MTTLEVILAVVLFPVSALALLVMIAMGNLHSEIAAVPAISYKASWWLSFLLGVLFGMRGIHIGRSWRGK